MSAIIGDCSINRSKRVHLNGCFSQHTAKTLPRVTNPGLQQPEVLNPDSITIRHTLAGSASHAYLQAKAAKKAAPRPPAKQQAKLAKEYAAA